MPATPKARKQAPQQLDIAIQLPTFSNGTLLEIQDIRDQQWEGARYRVTDAEQEAFSFVCRDFLAERLQTDRNNMNL